MKKLLFIIFLLTSTYLVYSQEKIKWMTWEEAVEASKKEKKKIFIDVYTDWCGWCKRMDASTFSHPVIAKYMNEHYYAIKFDAETKSEIKLGDKIYKTSDTERSKAPHELAVELLQGRLSYPTVVMLDENFNSLGPIPGYQTPESLEPMLKFIATDSYKTQKWDVYSQSFVSEIK